MKTITPLTLFAFGVITLIIGGTLGYTAGYEHGQTRATRTPARNFEECARSGNPVMESYPRQCRTRNGELFVEDVPLIPPPPESSTSSAPLPTSTSSAVTPTPRPAKPPTGACARAGCSSQLCVDAAKAPDTMSTCEFRAEYACYNTARCERQTTGECGWTQTVALKTCLQNPPELR